MYSPQKKIVRKFEKLNKASYIRSLRNTKIQLLTALRTAPLFPTQS